MQLTSTPLLARNVTLNLAGWAIPVVLALVAIPTLARQYGAARFGLLNLAWTAVGYFSLLDLGLGRAVTQVLAERFGRGRAGVVAEVVWTATLLLLPIVIVLASGVALAAGPIAERILPAGASGALRDEVVLCVRLMAIAAPVMAVTNILRGVLEAAQQFLVINALRVPLGVLTFAAPLATLQFSPSVAPAIAVLVGGRVVLCLAHAAACARIFPRLTRPTRLRSAVVGRLARVGGWITVTNLVNPILVSADRVVVSASLGVVALGYYATPQEAATKMWIFTGALLPVLFPAFAATSARDIGHTSALFDRATRVVTMTLLPVALLAALYAHDGLAWWLGADFARNGTPLLQVFAVTIFCNCVGQTAFTVLQAVGQQRATGLSHLVQLPLVLGALSWATPRYGLLGAAVVWGGRVVVDAAVAFGAVMALLPALRSVAARGALYAAIGMAGVAAAAVPNTLAERNAFACVALPVYLAAVWFAMLTSTERAIVRHRLLARAA